MVALGLFGNEAFCLSSQRLVPRLVDQVQSQDEFCQGFPSHHHVCPRRLQPSLQPEGNRVLTNAGISWLISRTESRQAMISCGRRGSFKCGKPGISCKYEQGRGQGDGAQSRDMSRPGLTAFWPRQAVGELLAGIRP